ncbi:hypothetical protein A1F97_09499 [Pyrenophora tritici-repentis]|nr:hypothetical protein PtrARCrB10_04765 [Pyrenophora tritici-repentis]PZD32713.1 hypothetical protein A1F97_09499 [Pyrenophora tritici-repentis]
MTQWIRAFESFLAFCKERKTPVVVTAGNKPAVEYVHDSYPQALAQPDDTTIIVGEISVHAPAEGFAVPKSGGVTPGAGEQAGTSQAAATVSGLIAYLYGLPNWQQTEYVRTTPIKRLLQDHAWLRSNAPVPAGYGPAKVVYNLARGDWQHDSNSAAPSSTHSASGSTSPTSSVSSVSKPSTSPVRSKRQSSSSQSDLISSAKTTNVSSSSATPSPKTSKTSTPTPTPTPTSKPPPPEPHPEPTEPPQQPEESYGVLSPTAKPYSHNCLDAIGLNMVWCARVGI